MIYQDQLHNQCLSNDPEERIKALEKLRENFSLLPDKQFAWNNLIELVNDDDKFIRFSAAYALGSAFCHVPDKQTAWNDLHRLTTDEDIDVRVGAASALGSAFCHVPDKQTAWSDLHRLTTDENIYVKFRAAGALSSSFSYVPNKRMPWNDLIKLANDDDRMVRSYANYSLGKISIFKASQAEIEEDYKRKLEQAITFFEKAYQESPYWLNPAQFCLPFYRSFHTIIFKKQEAKEEVNKYLTEAKDAVGDSKSKELLFEAVENLANALIEAQNLGNLNLEAMKGELNSYRIYCDRAEKLMREAEERVPFATIAMKKGLPILDRNLKGIIEEVQRKAKTACREAKGTPAEYAACAVNDFAKNLVIGSPKYLIKQIESLVFLLKSYVPKIEENSLILNRIDHILQEEDVTNQYMLLNNLIPQIIEIRVSAKTVPILNEVKHLRASVDKLTVSLDELQNPQEYLDIILRNLNEIKNDMPELKGKIDEVLYELYTPLSTTQKLKIAIPLIPLLASYELEMDVPKLVADKIDELKNLVLYFKQL